MEMTTPTLPSSSGKVHLDGLFSMSLIMVPNVALPFLGETIGCAAASTALMALSYAPAGSGLRVAIFSHAVARNCAGRSAASRSSVMASRAAAMSRRVSE